MLLFLVFALHFTFHFEKRKKCYDTCFSDHVNNNNNNNNNNIMIVTVMRVALNFKK